MGPKLTLRSGGCQTLKPQLHLNFRAGLRSCHALNQITAQYSGDSKPRSGLWVLSQPLSQGQTYYRDGFKVRAEIVSVHGASFMPKSLYAPWSIVAQYVPSGYLSFDDLPHTALQESWHCVCERNYSLQSIIFSWQSCRCNLEALPRCACQ